jgi:hypothetical protein
MLYLEITYQTKSKIINIDLFTFNSLVNHIQSLKIFYAYSFLNSEIKTEIKFINNLLKNISLDRNLEEPSFSFNESDKQIIIIPLPSHTTLFSFLMCLINRNGHIIYEEMLSTHCLQTLKNFILSNTKITNLTKKEIIDELLNYRLSRINVIKV